MKNKIILIMVLLVTLVVAAGCGGGSELKRQPGLSPEEVVHSFFDAAKGNRMNEAALYVSETSKGDMKTVLKYVTGQSTATIKNANLLSVRQVAQQGNYAAAVATLQQEQNSLGIVFKPVGLEKVDGEWYIVDYDQVFRDAKYQVLAQLLKSI
ncbi:hypothetical protein [Sporomusa acidovorans]|uniref:DUF4878 domain-containing protein n=1 Tax=Sporomusa acidovorans (strain ATCC 49682 / DSM 3132 / Mol) TaxID=1123286 RepID=A0ABZ3J4Q6_SPOA4|nr:hypothetical protein [Sporomusa acidovorans]OZC23092.1 hypothetical protein SPACI_09240 [Sporomusa acidovorans DSM 3132]SDF05238.1 hypothetical protein SAMN04488499_103127 [Sporomusa acidovorans]